jgi:hypothetical protein
MSTTTFTFEQVREELVALSVARAHQNKDSRAEETALLKRHGCASVSKLEELDDPATYERIIDEARELAGKLPRLAPTYDRILRFIQALQDGQCGAADKDSVYGTIVVTDDLGPTQREHLLKELKRKLPGNPAISSVRGELEAIERRAHARKHPLPKGAEPVIFRCHADDTVYGGVFDPATGKFVKGWELSAIKGPTGNAQICGMFGRAPIAPEQMSSGVFTFRPGGTPQVLKTPAGYEVNTWTPPALREKAVASSTVPPTVRKLLMHVLGGDEAVYEHFLNWLAVAYQTNDRTDTAWIITGRPGTGKGLLFKELIRPLFGFVQTKETKHLEGDFNEWFAHCAMLNVDEATSAGVKAPKVEAALRRYITEERVTMCEKFKNDVDVRNYCNVIITSNDTKPIGVPEGDRRYNVAPRQDKPLEDDDARRLEELVEQLRSELPQFAGYLAAYKIDIARARKPMRTEQREIMIENSTTTPERIGRAVKNGDLDWFLDEFWTAAGDAGMSGRGYVLLGKVRGVLLEWARAANPTGAKRLRAMRVPAWQVAALHNFLMPDKYERRPQEIGRLLGLKATARCGPHDDRGRAYRITWFTKETAEALATIVRDLEDPGPEAEKKFDREAFGPIAGNTAGSDDESVGSPKAAAVEWVDDARASVTSPDTGSTAAPAPAEWVDAPPAQGEKQPGAAESVMQSEWVDRKLSVARPMTTALREMLQSHGICVSDPSWDGNASIFEIRTDRGKWATLERELLGFGADVVW